MHKCQYNGCTKAFPSSRGLANHSSVMHKPSELKQFECDEPGCGKRLASISGIKKHKRSIHARSYSCRFENCTHTSRRESERDAHEKEVHTEGVISSAADCSKLFSDRSVQQNPSEPRHECDAPDCTRPPSTGTRCRNHKDKNHRTDTPQDFVNSTENCRKPIPAVDILIKRTNIVHDKMEAFPCSFDGCIEIFHSLDSLAIHLRDAHSVHGDMTKFPCHKEGCAKVYNRKGALQNHLRKVHSLWHCPKHRRWGCFRSSPELKAHQQVRT